MGHARWRRGLRASLFVTFFTGAAFAQPTTPVSDDGPAEPAPDAVPSTPTPAERAPSPPAEEPWIPPTPARVAPATGPPPHGGWIAPNTPRTIPYHGGDPTPPGYQFQSRPRWGFIIPGAILFTLGYSLAIATALEPGYQDRYWLFVPVVGPSARIIAEKAECDSRHGSEYCDLGQVGKDAGVEMVLLLFQAPGAAMLIGGIVHPKKRFVRNDLASVQVIPYATRSGGGMGLAGQF